MSPNICTIGKGLVLRLRVDTFFDLKVIKRQLHFVPEQMSKYYLEGQS